MTPARASVLLLGVVYLGFISLGLPDGTLGVAWPPMHRDLHLPIGLAGTLLLIVTMLAAISSFASGAIIRRFRTGPVVLVSCALTGTALLLISRAQNMTWLLAAALPLGFGAGAVDAGLNGYVARHYDGRHMNWLHACWGIGATCGPLLMASAIGSASGWRAGYAWIGTLQLCLAIVFVVTLGLWGAVPTRKPGDETHAAGGGSLPTLHANSAAGWLSAGVYILYTSVEGTAGLWAGSILVESRGLAPAVAGLCVSAYYGSITVGRLLSGFGVERWGNRRLVRAGALAALVGLIGFVFARNTGLAAVSIVVVGLGLAPIYPCLMHEVPRRFAPTSVQVVIGRQSGAAYIGVAATPALAGAIASASLEAITWVLTALALTLIFAIRRLDRMT